MGGSGTYVARFERAYGDDSLGKVPPGLTANIYTDHIPVVFSGTPILIYCTHKLTNGAYLGTKNLTVTAEFHYET